MKALSRLWQWQTTPSPHRLKAIEAPEIALTVFVVLIVGMMIIPLHTTVLDILITTNLAFAVVLLLAATHIPNGLAFASFPTILLISTLYRLALNISSTRLILVQADAGDVIRSFGTYVVQGNYVVGTIVFFILTIVQYLVIAKGSERVAEVGARFTLDAMPGKQMAIDADLRAGSLDYDQAHAKRQELHRESQFYGAMDGAMKFVKGDAIANIIIIGINIVGGVVIGTLMKGFPLEKSVKVYGLLTIGDGLVSQIPALLISTASALIVTRVASEHERSSLASDMVSQLLGNPKALFTGACLFAFLALVPGLPTFPFIVLAAILFIASRRTTHVTGSPSEATQIRGENTFTPIVTLPNFEIRLGQALYTLCTSEPGLRALHQGLEAQRKQLQDAMAIELPTPSIDVDPKLSEHGVTILVKGRLARRMAHATQGVSDVLAATQQSAQRHAHLWITMNTVQERLHALRSSQPHLVNQVIPSRLSLATLTFIMKALAEETIGLQTLELVLEAFTTQNTRDKTDDDLLSIARLALSDYMCEPLSRNASLSIYTIDPMIEDAIRESLLVSPVQTKIGMDPDLRNQILKDVMAASHKSPNTLILVTHADVRRPLWNMLHTEVHHLNVLSYDEIAPVYQVHYVGNITPHA